MMMQQMNIQKKIEYILENKHKINPLYESALYELQSSSINVNNPITIIRIQTLYKLLQPTYLNINIQLAKNQVPYPISSVVSFAHPQNQYQYVNMKTITWIQSGGTRCVPLKYTASSEEISKAISQTHSLIVPDCLMLNENNRNGIQNIIQQITKQQHYPTLFLGTSALIALQILSQRKVQHQYRVQKTYYQAYFNYQSYLPKYLEIPLRLAIQNKKKLSIPTRKIKTSELQNIKQFLISGMMKNRNEELYVISGQLKQKPVFFIFGETWNYDNADSIAVCHKLIGNFIKLSKEHKKAVSQKNIDKKLIASYKLVHKDDDHRSHFRIT